MNQTISRTILGQKLTISYQRALIWEDTATMVLADLHFGYSGKDALWEHDLLRLSDLVRRHNPGRIVILGDLFHSHDAAALDAFEVWRHGIRGVEILLIPGARDTLSTGIYRKLNVEVRGRELREGPFVFSRGPYHAPVARRIVVCGKIHPAITVVGVDKKPITKPCFYIGASHIILPAFAEGVPVTEIDPQQQEALYAISERGLRAVA